jgi:hypothetical protein
LASTTNFSAGTVLGKFLNGSQELYNFPAFQIHRTTVREELIREVERQGIEAYWEKKYVGIKEENSSGATVLFEGGEAVDAEFVKLSSDRTSSGMQWND